LCITVTRSTTAQRHVEIVLDDDEAHVRRQRRQQRDQLAPLGRGQSRRRLVEQDEPRRPRQRHADLELPLLAVGQRGRRLVGDRGQAHPLHEIVRRALRGVRGRRPPESEPPSRHAAHREEQVVPHREVSEQERGLIGPAQAHPDPLVRGHVGHVLAEEAHAGRPSAGSRR
jgi:hypothetical protein